MELRIFQIKKQFFLIAFLFVITFAANAQTDLLFNWAKAINANVPPILEFNNITTDEPGNIYTTGFFCGTVDFDPSERTANLTGKGFRAIFFAKYDAEGNFVFAKNIEVTDSGMGSALAVDKAGNIYITGAFQGTADFDPSLKTVKLTSAGDFDSFLAKYDANGNYIFAKRMGGKGDNRSHAIALDGIGNIYITGNSSDAVLVKNKKNEIGTSIVFDMFLAKYDSNGNFVYSKTMGGNSFIISSAIEVSNSGYIYVTGSFERTADFDPSDGIANLVSSGQEDIFIAKYKADGSYVFAKNIGGMRRDKSTDIELDNSENVYITGFFEENADFDPGVGVKSLISPKPCSLFVAKYDPDGNYTFAKSMSGGRGAIGNAIAIDGEANIYVAGIYVGTVDFDPDAPIKNLTSIKSSNGMVNVSDIFIAKYDFEGHYVYAKSIGGTDDDKATSIALSNDNSVYITGSFDVSADFDPSVNNYDLTSKGSFAAFIACYKEGRLNSAEVMHK